MDTTFYRGPYLECSQDRQAESKKRQKKKDKYDAPKRQKETPNLPLECRFAACQNAFAVCHFEIMSIKGKPTFLLSLPIALSGNIRRTPG